MFTKLGDSTCLFGPGPHDGDSISLTGLHDLFSQEIGTALVRINEHERRFGPTGDEDKTRQPPTGPEVDHRPRQVPRLLFDRPHEAEGVVDLVIDGHGAQKVELSRTLQLSLDRRGNPEG
jgi:hypothetical protein